ncbi:MAG: response regulator transcription factor [Deltaproteobacteria bacterium]|nr:response regulator transcription factor [Deltaproteobacteria bacterium]
MPVRILIADDHAVVREGLRLILESTGEMCVIGEAVDGRDALQKAEALTPDVIIMDIAMPEMNGIDATQLICKLLPAVKVIILSMHHTNEHIFRAIQAGAKAYLLKESAGASVMKAVNSVMRGQMYFGAGVDNPMQFAGSPSHTPSKSPLDSLSRREREVLQMVVEGKTSVEIAEVLFISPKSVETYRSRLMLKLSVTNIPSLVKFALQHGITPVENS